MRRKQMKSYAAEKMKTRSRASDAGRMRTGSLLLFVFVPIVLEGCCVTHHLKKKTVSLQDATRQHYRAVEGEVFMMPCVGSSNPPVKTLWFRTEGGGGGERRRKGGEGGGRQNALDCTTAFPAEAKHSGEYTNTVSKLVLHLQVLERNRSRCFEFNKSSIHLVVAVGGTIYCPGFFCGGNNSYTNNNKVVWYKGNRTVSDLSMWTCENQDLLSLCQVSEHDSGVFFCDRLVMDQGSPWTLRRPVNVTAIPFETARNPPRIPEGNRTEEVEVGQPHNLTCKVYFDFELEFSPKVQWYLNYNGNMDDATPLHMDEPEVKQVKLAEYEVTQTVVINKVTLPHLKHTYTCVATNTKGNKSVAIQFKRKVKVRWPSLVGYPVVFFLLFAALGAFVHVKWLEIRILYKSHFSYGKHDGDEKDFDVFLSYVWSFPSADLAEGSSSSSRSGLSKEEGVFPPSAGLLSPNRGEVSPPPDVLLPHVLEDQWGFRLCLLERDIVPGGAYTNDIVLAIKRSRMLVCVLSAEYLTNTNAVFVLESGVQALLQRPTFKLLLIRTDGPSPSPVRSDPSLPHVVQRALKVLPSLDWSSEKPVTGNGNFWRSLRKKLPETQRDTAAVRRHVTPTVQCQL